MKVHCKRCKYCKEGWDSSRKFCTKVLRICIEQNPMEETRTLITATCDKENRNNDCVYYELARYFLGMRMY